MNPAIAATRALAKARLGDREALHYLERRNAEGDLAARRALDAYNKHHASVIDASDMNLN
jgi:hypothetical protein